MSDAGHLALELKRVGQGGARAAARRHWHQAQQDKKTAARLHAGSRRHETYESRARTHLILAAVLEEVSREPRMPDAKALERTWARLRDQYDREPGDFAVMLHRRLRAR